jgi:hypothetical protein
VLAASPDRPVVIVAGGQGTTVASAYLLALASGQGEQFADRVVVAWSIGLPGGEGDYNAWVDPWATHIVFGRLRVVAYPYDQNAYAHISKSELTRIPFEPLRRTLINREHHNGNPGGVESDFMGAVPLTRDDYVQSEATVSVVDGPVVCSSDFCGRCNVLPHFVEGGDGRAIRVTSVRPGVATEEWWRWMTDPTTYGRSPAPFVSPVAPGRP